MDGSVVSSSRNLKDLLVLKICDNRLTSVYNEAKKKALRSIECKKKSNYQELIVNSDDVVRSSWNVVRELTNKKKKPDEIVIGKDEGIVMSDAKTAVKKFYDFFVESLINLMKDIPLVNLTYSNDIKVKTMFF
ncbi:hypothetical protein JTB14_020038 [Gonioctena quinquepunctata]|nr:hypothetical protein JTB14_020038 [Gonioctena quinquepunctata]